MSQATISSLPGTTTATDWASQTVSAWAAERSMHSGGSRPSYAEAGTQWLDTTGNPWLVKVFDGTDDIVLAALDTSTNAPRLLVDADNDSYLTLGASDDEIIAVLGGSTKLALNATGLTLGSGDAPRATLDLRGTDAAVLPSGTTAQRPGTAIAGMTRHSSTSGLLEYYNGSAWVPVRTLPPNMLMFVAQETAPPGTLKANGAAVSRTTYSDLFAAIGTTFGVGDGSTTFDLPDIRSDFIRGWDDGRGVDAARALGSFQDQSTQDHKHRMPSGFDSTRMYGWQDGSGNPIFGSETLTGNRTTLNGTSDGSSAIRIGYTDVMRDVTGNTYPRNTALLACITY